MRINHFAATTLIFASAVAFSGCQAQSPSSPSAIPKSGSFGSASGGGLLRLFGQSVDAPAGGAATDPAAPPAAAPDAPWDPTTPLPAGTNLVSIVGTFGAIAYTPNPRPAAIGEKVIWKNDDVRMHHIVLDNGTDIGDVMPGQATAPITVSVTEPTMYHCTIHPSMIGAINGDASLFDMPEAPSPPDYDPGSYYSRAARGR